ncbi:MAG: hypothetical protein WKF47_05595 [Geodermatophilaceae bacterium]
MAAGVIKVGDEIEVLPSGLGTTDQRDRHPERPGGGGLPTDVGHVSASARTWTSPAAT